PVDVLLREHLVEGVRVELRVAPIQERDHGFRRLEDERDHLRLIRAHLFVPGEEDEAVRRRHLVRLETLHRGLDRLRYVLAGARALDVRRLRLLSPSVVRHIEDRPIGRDVHAHEFRAAADRFFDLLESAAELVFVHPRHLSHCVSLHSYLSFITFCVANEICMEKVVVSLGGSVLVPGDDDARYLRDVARLFRDVSSRVKLFVVTGGGRVARYYIETGRSVGIRERSLDEFGIAVTRLNARLLSAALGGRANREPATSYAAASKLAKRYPIVVMGGTRPGHTTDRVAASLARFVGAHRIVNATSVDGVYSADPKKDPGARLVPRMRFGDLVTLSGKGHRTAGPSVVFDPVAARVVARDRTPLSVVHGRDLRALRAALLGEPFHG